MRKGIRALLEGIVFLPLHSGNVKRADRVKKIWIGKYFREKIKKD